jgi:hypothetical protein
LDHARREFAQQVLRGKVKLMRISMATLERG